MRMRKENKVKERIHRKKKKEQVRPNMRMRKENRVEGGSSEAKK